MKTSIPRLRSIRMKAGGAEFHVLRHYIKNDRASIESEIGVAMDAFFTDGLPAGGFAFVVWDCEGASQTRVRCWNGSSVHRADAAEFVKGCVLLHVAEKW